MSAAVKASDITWETNDGETYGYFDLGANGDIEISITGRIRRSMWTTGTNERTWSVCDEDGKQIAIGHEEGLRNAKRAALKALSDYLTTAA